MDKIDFTTQQMKTLDEIVETMLRDLRPEQLTPATNYIRRKFEHHFNARLEAAKEQKEQYTGLKINMFSIPPVGGELFGIGSSANRAMSTMQSQIEKSFGVSREQMAAEIEIDNMRLRRKFDVLIKETEQLRKDLRHAEDRIAADKMVMDEYDALVTKLSSQKDPEQQPDTIVFRNGDIVEVETHDPGTMAFRYCVVKVGVKKLLGGPSLVFNVDKYTHTLKITERAKQ